MAENLRVSSLNIRGLNSYKKQSLLAEYCRLVQTDILFLQETYLMRSKALLMKQPWTNQILSTDYSSSQRGVIIMIRKTVPYIIRAVQYDPEGRYIIVQGSWNGINMMLINLYAPLRNSGSFFSFISAQVMMNGGECICAGDCNLPLSLPLDRRSSIPYQRTAEQIFFAETIKEAGLVDVWRQANPDCMEFSFRSVRYDMASRLDYIFCSAYLAEGLMSAEMSLYLFTDHAMVKATLRPVQRNRDVSRWRMPAGFLFSYQNKILLKQQIEFFFSENKAGDSSPGNRWEAFKVTIRGWIMRRAALVNRKERERVVALTQEIQGLEKTLPKVLLLSPAYTALSHQLSFLRAELVTTLQTSINARRFHANRLNFFEADRSPRLLAWKLRSENSQSIIQSLSNPSGGQTSDPAEINKIFAEYFAAMYTAVHPPDNVDLNTFIVQAQLPRITDEHFDLLELPLSIAEIKMAISSLPHYKAPGPDGIPNEVLQLAVDTISLPLLDMFEEALELQTLPVSLTQADIILILKKDKPSALRGSYRPIALINSDIKIYAKMLAARLAPVLRVLIHDDQSAFIAGRGVANNLQSLSMIMYNFSRRSEETVVCLMDIAKAFDTLGWSFMWQVLRGFGFGPRFISMIQLLYANPVSRICTGKHTSPFFQLQRGTRQGCPLSPMLFVLAIETLAANIRRSSVITGVPLRSRVVKALFFADDLLLVLTKPEQSLSIVFQLLEEFAVLSGLRTNAEKTEVLSLWADEASPWRLKFLPSCFKTSIRYLGIIFELPFACLVTKNVAPLVEKAEANLRRWSKIPLTLRGKIQIIKMMIMPMLLYPWINIPIMPDKALCARLSAATHKFLWNGKPARISRATLQLNRYEGGLALPNYSFYWIAAQFEWLRKLLITQQYLGHYFIRDLLYAQPKLLEAPTHLQRHVCQLGTFMYNFDLKFPNQLSCWCPVGMLPKLPGEWKRWARAFWPEGLTLSLTQILVQEQLLQKINLEVEFGFPKCQMAAFRYKQLVSTLRSFFLAGGTLADPGPLEELLFSEEGLFAKKSILAKIYAKLSPSTTPSMNHSWDEWEVDVGYPIAQEERDRLWYQAMTDLPSSFQKIILYKIIHRTYITPEKINKWNPRASAKCWKCVHSPGDMIHLLWRCPKLHRYWAGIFNNLSTFLRIELDLGPGVALLHIMPASLVLSKPKRRFLHIGLIAAKKIILMKWKSIQVPVEEEWVKEMLKVGEYYCPDDTSIKQERKELCESRGIWLEFKNRMCAQSGISS